MKTISNSEFSTGLSGIIEEVTTGGEVVRVERENGGNFVVMEEAEYNLMLEALRMIFAASASVSSDEETISVSGMFAEYDRLKQ